MLLPLAHYHDKLSDTKLKYNLLAKLEEYFRSEFKLTPCIGIELEFYLDKKINIADLSKKIGYQIKAEKGVNQYEIDLPPSTKLVNYAKLITKLRNNIINYTSRLGYAADFSSKPFSNDYGSSMHIHINFLEGFCLPIFKDELDFNIDICAQILCHYLLDGIKYFLPTPHDYQRLDSKFMAPTHISYGNNNRTVLIRIPDSKPLRLEHRLPAATSDPALTIYTILHSIAFGIMHPKQLKPISKIYGNAFDAQYNLTKIIGL